MADSLQKLKIKDISTDINSQNNTYDGNGYESDFSDSTIEEDDDDDESENDDEKEKKNYLEDMGF